ncbi:PGF-CTERM sorting domain-containing protein [Halomicroarcula sp. GCM10025324]|uniref:DUF7490 domain-containing protein n=1 Tax=Haloarcula TaxID=2237 RepID=UPI0023E7824C|nr:PGF-CTERM sorting domain-containing protein [Halomicroarcula sp. ZS-22-S1]
MRREVTLAGAMVLLILAMAAGATAVPDVLTEPDEDIRPSHLDLRETTVNATEVGGETVTLALDSRVAHRGGTARNVTVETRVVDTETGLVATTRRQSLGNVTGEREVSVTTDVTVEREGGYRMETIVYADGERRTTGRTEVRNVDALTPAYAESSVSFHRFENTDVPLRAISYRIESVADNRTTLNVSVYFTNRGDEPAGDLTLRLRARQADSNVIADETRLSVGQIRPGRTETIDAELTVPDGYNYWLDGILQSDGVIVATESAPANLDPQETLELNETRRDVGFQSGDFAEEPERERATEAPEREATIGGSGPGFTAVAALAALLAGTIALARRRL